MVLRVDDEAELLRLALHHGIPAAGTVARGNGLGVVDVLRLVPRAVWVSAEHLRVGMWGGGGGGLVARPSSGYLAVT